MFRRTCVTALQRSTLRYAAPAAPKAAPAAAAGAAAAASKAPETTTKAGASSTGGDTVMDKFVLVAALTAVAVWWVTVPGPQHQH
ncbi:hypothetical protein NESM_000468200 [Novymonas esmeraldas]|uniref:Uncharacterized protein n=1 Tax=Novymonas esmeraldas TaxID=1808958 RepID=A0AAW0EPL1_9TRYP